jgi:hypothetical protein
MIRRLDYDPGPDPAYQRRLVRAVLYLVIAKLGLVAFNTAAAFGVFPDLPEVVRWAGIGTQVGLTVLLLIALLKMTSRR